MSGSIHVQSVGVSEEEEIFSTEDDYETEEQLLQRKKEARAHPTTKLHCFFSSDYHTKK